MPNKQMVFHAMKHMRAASRYSFLLAGLVVAGACAAQSTADGAAYEKSTSERLTQIEADTLLLKAREKQIDVQSNILTKQNEIKMKQALNDQLSNKVASGDPMVRSIEGIGKTMYATLQLHNGSLIDAKVGDVLPNGMKVVSISSSEVIVQGLNKRRTRLAGMSAMRASAEFDPNYPGTGLSIPPLPLAVQRGTGR